jgi:cyclohexanone monooxygenase
VLVHPSCNSWYNDGSLPGKKRMHMGYTCDEIAAGGYTGFKLA